MRLILVIWSLAGVVVAGLSLMGIDSAGFPDGYISPYDRFTLLPQTVLSVIILLVAMVILLRCALNRAGRFDAVLGLAMLPCLYVPMHITESCPRWPICAAIFERTTGMTMNDGIGG